MDESKINDHLALLIDDNKDFLLMLKERLQGIDICVDYATSSHEARKYFSKKYNVIAAKYKLNGITGADIINIYKIKYPNVHTIVYTSEPIEDDTRSLEIDKLYKNMVSTDINNLIESIKLFCINKIEPQIIESIFTEINKIKKRLSILEESINSIKVLSTTVESLDAKVKAFIGSHKNDAYKIIAAFATLEALRAIWEKFFK